MNETTQQIDARIQECKIIRALVGKSHHMDIKKKDMAYYINKRIAALVMQRQEWAAIELKKSKNEEQIRDSEYNSTLSILRGMGVKFDSKEAWKIRKQWKASAKAEAERKAKLNG